MPSISNGCVPSFSQLGLAWIFREHMGLTVSLVTGPRHAGKSTFIQMIEGEVCTSIPHHVRLIQRDEHLRGGQPANSPSLSADPYHAEVVYDPIRVFETVPEILTQIHARDRYGCVIIEAKSDPNLLQAYPYDFGMFVMPAPESEEDVFRSSGETKRAFELAMNDTAEFASEFFGVCEDDDSWSGERKSPKPDMSDTQMTHLLQSPLGKELAARIQCRPEYHGMVDSNIIIVNTGVGGTSGVVDKVVARLETLVTSSCSPNRGPVVYCCDLMDPDDPRRKKLLDHLRKSKPKLKNA